jgi:hypothetical protein
MCKNDINATPSPQVELVVITSRLELACAMGLEQVINERVSFLREQINPKNKPEVNSSFQVQIEVLRSVDYEKVAVVILRKKAELVKCKDVTQLERLYNELDALEWLQRQVAQHIA